jgi:hypothetical protein
MKQENIIQKNGLNPGSFFYPRIIREFDDGPDEKPLVYGGC